MYVCLIGTLCHEKNGGMSYIISICHDLTLLGPHALYVTCIVMISTGASITISMYTMILRKLVSLQGSDSVSVR